ncbi:MAG: nickel pincer cofactor biosynthesis protein LarB, partial [Planctomycetes bacterium]|nr:nickel pincer cofactor biosynthesis protein LarB [Planctomycetota bacterium]
MTEETLRQLLDAVRSGSQSVDEAITRLRVMPFEDLGFAKVDHHRSIRCGFPEVIYSEGKTPEQVAKIFERCAHSGANVIATRASAAVYDAVARAFPNVAYHEASRVLTLRQNEARRTAGAIAIVTAGTSDIPVAEEARLTAEIMDQATIPIHDVGVAGIHRLLSHAEVLQSANVIVVVAGMEGALPSVVGGLVDVSVIAVPTSVGYGASLGGLSALFAMLNSCASGVTVVTIDNGF